MAKTERKYKTPSLRYPGGKARVAKKIVAEMPPHKVYVEPFAGAAHVFFQKPKVEKNVLNDKNEKIIDFFSNIKGRKICCKIDANKERFNTIREKNEKSTCDYVYLNKNSYGGKHVFDGNPSYGYIERNRGHVCIDGSKLEGVRLERKDFKDVIKEYDSKDTLFYVDPPYVKANEKECIYGKKNCSTSPQEVADTLRKIKGKVIVSYDDHPEVRRAFKGFKVGKLGFTYSIARSDQKDALRKTKELLIKNFKGDSRG